MNLSMKTYLLVGVLSSLPLQNLSGGWLERKAEGWFWYEDREKKQKVEEQLEPPTPLLTSLPASSAQIPLTATEEMALIRKDLEERLNKAMLDPTEENVIAYMHMQQHWIHQSAQFSQVWLRNLLNAPELDSRLHDPVTQYGVQVQKQILREQREERIRDLAKTYGLFFFYEGNNKVSQAFSFVVRESSQMVRFCNSSMVSFTKTKTLTGKQVHSNPVPLHNKGKAKGKGRGRKEREEKEGKKRKKERKKKKKKKKKKKFF